jgi:hypothetical protein
LQTGRAKALGVKGKIGSMSMSERAPKVSSDRAKCDGPVEGFVAFAKRLTAPNAAQRLQKLADGPDADRFVERLVQEAFGGSAHAATCLSLIGRFGSDPSWAEKLRAVETAGEAPAPDHLKARDLAPVGCGLRVISSEKALPWLARAYLRLKTASAARTAVQTVLLDAAPTTHALAGVLSDALGTLESGGLRLTKGMAKQCADTLEQHAQRHADAKPEAAESPLARLAKLADRADVARLVSALLDTPAAALPNERRAGSETDNDTDGSSEDTGSVDGGNATATAIAQAAWSEADEALGRALQDMAFLDQSFERLESAAEGDLAERARKAKGASNLVLQWVRQAARLRRVAALNKVGDRVPFDPSKLVVDGGAAVGELVRVVKPPVVRGSETQQVVLVPGEAEVE